MKRLFLAMFAIIFIAGCSKHAAVSTGSFNGTWELTKASGQVTISYPAGNGNLLKFSGNNYQVYTGGTLKNSGTFNVVDDTTASTSVCLVFSPGQFNTRIIFDTASTSTKTFIDISGNTLTLVSGCFALDGGSFRYYTRKSNGE